ncbi:MAG: NYN domain-containing protein [Pseudomonadota bacterium]
MSVHIIIDGYNLIRQSHRLSILDRQELQLGREALLDTLAAYKRNSPHRITVVFDGASAPDILLSPERIQGIEVTYSHQGESADSVIKQLAARKKEKALVVSSDRDIIQYVSARGATTIGSLEFEQKINDALYGGKMLSGTEDEGGWTPTTRKKGPGRRPPKRERRNMQKINKL